MVGTNFFTHIAVLLNEDQKCGHFLSNGEKNIICLYVDEFKLFAKKSGNSM